MKKKDLCRHIPELRNIKDISKYKNIFEEHYKERYKKVGEKAIYSSIALTYGELVKDFNEGRVFSKEVNIRKRRK